MENGGAQGGSHGNQLRGGGAHRGNGRGQGGMVGRGGGGFHATNQGFHPGYGGGGRGYSGRGGGRYGGGRGRHDGSNYEGRGRGGAGGRRGRGYGQADGGHLCSGDQQIEDALKGQPIVPNVHGNGTQTPTLPADVAALLQQALASIHQGAHPPPVKDNVNAMAKTTKPKEGNDASELVPIHKMSKATQSNEAPESSAQAATRDSSGKTPYCYRCLTKGHVREDCDAEMYCDICDCIEHFTSRCPKFRGDKPCAIPCGYAVEGLGFYHIPQSVTPQQRSDPRAAVIRVTDGTLIIPNVISELERLIPGKWKWNVESGGNSNTFKTLFPSKTKLKRMAEWGVVQTKFNNAKLKIEERPLGVISKF